MEVREAVLGQCKVLPEKLVGSVASKRTDREEKVTSRRRFDKEFRYGSNVSRVLV